MKTKIITDPNEIPPKTHKEMVNMAKKDVAPKIIAKELGINAQVVVSELMKADALRPHEEVTEAAITLLRSNNMELGGLISDTLITSMRKARDLSKDVKTPKELLDNMRVVELAARVAGMIPKENQTNVQVNNIVGFEFIEINGDEIDTIQKDRVQ